MLAALALATLLQAAAPARVIAFDRPETATTGPALTVGSGSFPDKGDIPLQYSGYGRNLAPAVTWSAGPAGTRSYVLIVEDPAAGEARPLLHWLAYDLPPQTTALPSKTRNRPRVEEPAVFSQGINDHGGLGWTGPHPPVGDPVHPYHVQVFALDRRSVARPGASFAEVLPALKGHVLAKGQMVGLYAEAAPKPRKPRKGEAAEVSPPPPAP